MKALDKVKFDNNDQKVGVDIIRRAILTPVRLIAENAGVDGAVVSGKLLESKNTNWGYDAQSGEYVDMVKAGIIDPTKVVRCALQDAASVAALLITTEANDRRSSGEEARPDGGAGGGMGGMGRHGLLSPSLSVRSFV